MRNIVRNITLDLLKNKAIITYMLLLSVLGWGMFALESQPEKVILTYLQINLIVLPLVTSVFATVYYFNSEEFLQLLLIQPIARSKIIFGFFVSLNLGFIVSYLVGIGLPLLMFYPSVASLHLVLSGIFLTVIFTGIALMVSTYQNDKSRSMGVVLILWAFFSFIYDGLQLLVIYQFAEYPIEQPMLFSIFFNPISVSRTLVIMQTEASALLGLSGAVFRDFFGSDQGIVVSITTLGVWAILPFLMVRRKFIRKNF